MLSKVKIVYGRPAALGGICCRLLRASNVDSHTPSSSSAPRLSRALQSSAFSHLSLRGPILQNRTSRVSTAPTLSSSFSQQTPANMAYTAIERGTPDTDTYQVYFKDASGPISPMHDIPWIANAEAKTYNAVIEVPRWTNAKMEIDTCSPLNPIKQDQKKGKLRYVANSFPHHGYIWNYGAIPQTWENPNHTDENTGAKGDNDPVDICEIGHRVAKRGDVLEVKILGTLAMIDDGETDWKMIVIDVKDPLAEKLNTMEDVEKEMPGFLAASREWFRIYKMPDGKPENKFAFNGEYKDAEFSHKILEETHGFWRRLVGLDQIEDAGGLCPKTVTVEGAKFGITREEAEEVFNKSAEPAEGAGRADSVDTWHYVHLQ